MSIDWIKVTGAAQDGYGYVETEKACRRRDRTADAIVAALKEIERQSEEPIKEGDTVRVLQTVLPAQHRGKEGVVRVVDGNLLCLTTDLGRELWVRRNEIEVIS